MLLGTEGFETEILKLIHNALQCSFMDGIMKFFSAINDVGLLWIVVAVMLICIKKYRKTGITVGIGLLIGVILGNLILKNLVARPRPCWLDPTIQLIVENPTDFSFPSGHTLSSFIAALVLFDHDKRLGIPALCIAAIIAFSRLYLMVHFPTDVLGAIVLAFGINLIMKKTIKGL